MDAIGETRLSGETEDVGGPGLGAAGGRGREKNGNVRGRRNDDILHGRIVGGHQVGGVRFEAGMFEAADDNAGVGQDFGYAVVKKILREYAVIGFHRGGGDGDNPSRAEFFGNAESDGSAHGMTRENGAVRNDHAAGRESANERRGAGFSLGGREGSRGAAVAGKVGDVHAEALFGEGAADVLHDDVVGGDAVEENHRAEFGGGGKIFTFDSENLHAAGGGVDDIAFFGVATAGEIDESAADEQTEDASERFVSLRNRFQRESSPEMAQVRA